MVSALRKLGHQVDVLPLVKPSGVGGGATGVLASARHALPRGTAEAARLAANLPEYLMARKTLWRLKPDLIYKRHAVFDAAASLAARHAGVPLVLEVNALYSSLATQGLEPLGLWRVAAAIERRVLRSTHLVVAVSTPLGEHIRWLAGPDVRVCVVPNGADLEMFDPARVDGRRVRMRYGLTGRFVVGWTGVLRSWHGVELLVQALPHLQEAVLLVVGDGPERMALERLAGSLGVAERLHITGRIPYSDVTHHVAAFDAAVAADDRTGFACPMKGRIHSTWPSSCCAATAELQ
jgi:glycosyltransferase involved in cell wall biosynthesis